MKLDLHFGLDTSVLFDWRVLALTACAGVAAGGLLGLVPAVHGTRADVGSALKTGSRGSDAPGPLRWRSVLIAAQIAMSLVLLAVGDPADGRRRADEQAAIPHGRRRHAHLAERGPLEYL
jgi:hypothetical protein